MPEWLYDAGPNGLWIFLLVTVILGGAAAFATGRAMAQAWQPVSLLLPAMLLLGCGVRFVHYAIFAEPLLSLGNYSVDTVILLLVAVGGYRWIRAGQMQRQYGWRSGA